MRSALAVALLLLCAGCADVSDPMAPPLNPQASSGTVTPSANTEPSATAQESRHGDPGTAGPPCGAAFPYSC